MVHRTVAVCALINLLAGPLVSQDPSHGLPISLPREYPKEAAGATITGTGRDPGLAVAGSRTIDVEFSQVKVKYQPPPPPYPPIARLARIQGTVIVKIRINTEGIPEQATAIQGPPQLRPVSENFAMAWRFEPTLMHGVPVRAVFLLNMPFHLRATTRVKIHQAVVEMTTADPVFQSMLPDLRAEAAATLKRLGVTQVDGTANDPEQTHHLLIEVSRPSYGGTGLVISLRCCLLKDVLLATAGSLKPKVLDSWSREDTPGLDPATTLKNELRQAISDVVEDLGAWIPSTSEAR